MDVELNTHEARVLGVLIEKGCTTPDQYPLSLNATTNGCNQKSNRHPLTDYGEAEVTIALTGLKYKHLVGASTPAGSRVERFRHNAKEHLRVDNQELAVLAELLLRGPQTPGELRQRASRMHAIANLDELQQALAKLAEAGYVTRLPPAAGSRAERYGQLLSGEIEASEAAASVAPSVAPSVTPSAAAPAGSTPAASPGAGPDLAGRVTALEAEVAGLRAQLRGLAEQLGETLE